MSQTHRVSQHQPPPSTRLIPDRPQWLRRSLRGGAGRFDRSSHAWTPRRSLAFIATALGVLVSSAACRAASPLGPATLMLDDQAAVNPSAVPFGDAGARYWTLLAGVAYNHDSTDANLYAGLGFFLADNFEFNFGAGAWCFWQEGEDTAGGNPTLGFRYHFSPHEPFDLYLDAGIGLLFTADDVPDDGESVNFTPRAGVGTLWRIGDTGTRLDLGLRWHHISTASTTGSDDNPSRDSIMLYAGIVVPF